MTPDEMMAMIAELTATTQALREQIMALQQQIDAEAPIAPPQPAVQPEADPAGEPAVVDPIPVIDPEPEPGLSFDEAWDALPPTEMMLAFEDDAFIRNGRGARVNEHLTRDHREFFRGTQEDDVFVQDVFVQTDFSGNWVDVNASIRFPELPGGSRINGLDGYDAVHLNADADTKTWVQLLDVEYLRVNFEPGSKTAWGGDGTEFASAQTFGDWEIPDAAYVYVDGEFGTAEIFDNDFQLVG